MSSNRQSRYCCRFCSEQLVRRELHETSAIYRLLPVKTFKCPHCFCTYTRPAEAFLMIPGLQRLLNRRGTKQTEVQQKNYGLSDERRFPFTPLGVLARIARFTGTIEKLIWGLLLGVLKLLFNRRTSRSEVTTVPLSRRESSSRSSHRRRSSHGLGDSARTASSKR